MYDLDGIKMRLANMAKRREMEGSYTDQAICEQAAALIKQMEEALEEAENFACQTLGWTELDKGRKYTSKVILTALNYGHAVDEDGRRA